MKHLPYMRYLLTHKTRVFVHALILGVPFRGLFHDFSKFSPVEWKGIGRQFFPSTPEEKEANASLFKQAKAHHRVRNQHEVDYWYGLSLNGRAVQTDTLDRVLTRLGAFDRRMSILIIPGPNDSVREVAAIMDLCYKAGLTNIHVLKEGPEIEEIVEDAQQPPAPYSEPAARSPQG